MNNNLHIENILDDLLTNKITRPEAAILLAQEGVTDSGFEIDLHLSGVNAISRYHVLNQVQAVHNKFIAARNISQASNWTSGKIVTGKINPVKWLVRIAASVILIISAWFTYQYSNTTSGTLYSEIYQPYSINTDRGMGEIKTHNMVPDFKQNNYGAVIKTFESLASTNNREKFLAGYAYHQTGSYQRSLGVFQQILAHNRQTNTRLYNDEAEFYSGLAYLKLKDNQSATNIFESIRKNPNHTFYERIDKWTLTRLKWLK